MPSSSKGNRYAPVLFVEKALTLEEWRELQATLDHPVTQAPRDAREWGASKRNPTKEYTGAVSWE